MPFIARCDRCNYYLWALTRDMLNIYMGQHDIGSHKDYDSYEHDFWHIMTISHADYYMIQRMSKFPAFWNALRRSPKQLSSHFSGQRNGEFKPYCKPN